MLARLNSLRLSLLSAVPALISQRRTPVDLGIRNMASYSGPVETATFAAGCFWGVEHIFLKHWPPAQNKGILRTAVGYTGGRPDAESPSYRQVCSGVTQHAEALKIEFDPSVLKYEELVGACFRLLRHCEVRC